MITDYYKTAATVYSIVESINELGPDESSAQFTVVTNIDCAIETLGKDERYLEGTEILFATHRIYCGITSTAVQENHVLRIGTADYDIQAVINPMEMDHHQEILVQLRT